MLIYGRTEKKISGAEAQTTNQRMELMAAARALQALKAPCDVILYSDSAYLVNAFNQHWLDNWQKNGWLNAKKNPVENKTLWMELLEAAKPHHLSWRKVKGHAGDKYNEICDQLARDAIKTLS